MAFSSAFLFVAAFAVLWFAGPSHAFGAGNIISVSTVEGTNWRHGDIEETLLQLVMIVGKSEKFDDLAVKRVYFGNWLRDYSQAIDVGGLKQLPADTLRILIWVLSFMTFGYATQEFEVTAERLGTYRPEEHIDNPKDYADNEDARKYDQRLRGPVDEGKELAIDPKRGLKNYIMNESVGITTSAALVRDRFIQAINLGREYTKGGDKNKLYEALRNLGTGLHCMEDFSAHSNFVELTLRELGEKDIFPIVGDKTEVDIEGKKIYPLVTGTFGMTDFLHSVVGEVSDKVAQSEITQLESKLDDSTNKSKEGGGQSYLQKILDMVPFGLLGDYSGTAEELQKNADAKQMENAKLTEGPSGKMVIGGYDTEELKKQAQDTLKNMYPILEFHDNVMKTISQAVDSVPGLSSMLDDLTGAIQIFVFSLLSPYLKPVLAQCKSELQAGSGGVLETSEKAQFNVFEDDKCSDPTHSMLSKDHFSHVLNTIAGQVAAETLKFAVNAITEAWGDDSKDPRKVTDWILQCFFHPALKKENCPGQQAMLDTVKNWWERKDDSEKEELRQALSKQGVKDGKNHVGDGADDHGANHHAKPRMQKADKEETQQRPTEKSKPRREEEDTSSGGRSGGYGQDTETSSGDYGGGRSGGYGQDTETTSGYGGRSGGGYGGDQESSSGYGRTEESSGYGRSEETSGYGRSEETSGYGRSEETSGYGRSSQREEESSYGGREESSGYGQDTERETTTQYTGRRTLAERIDDPTGDGPGTSSYDRDNTSGMPGGYGNTESSSGYGRNESSGYGESRDTEDTYDSGRRRGDDEQEGYGRESRY